MRQVSKSYRATKSSTKLNLDHLHDDAWRKLTQIYKNASSDIEDVFTRVEKLAQLQKLNAHASEFELLRDFLKSRSSSVSSVSSTSSQIREVATLPCILLPRTLSAQCYDRDPIIKEIEKFFTFDPSIGKFRSIALWGLGGVGKSHVALKYAQGKVDKLEAIFWVYSNSATALAQSFTDIAVRLQLPNTNPQNHEENRISVLNWLQQTCILPSKPIKPCNTTNKSSSSMPMVDRF